MPKKTSIKKSKPKPRKSRVATLRGRQKAKALVVERVFSAPSERVWEAWTRPEIFTRWWGPKNFTSPFAEFDLIEGGKYASCMCSPDGKEYWGVGVYQEVVPEKKIVMVDSFADGQGNQVPASYYGMNPDFPLEMMITVIFKKPKRPFSGDLRKTKLVLLHEGIPENEQTETSRGWNESFDKLEKELEEEMNQNQ